MRAGTRRKRYVICIGNSGYRASLVLRKIYRVLDDPDSEALGLLRVIDESGEDYLFPESSFVPVELPKEASKLFSRAS